MPANSKRKRSEARVTRSRRKVSEALPTPVILDNIPVDNGSTSDTMAQLASMLAVPGSPNSGSISFPDTVQNLTIKNSEEDLPAEPIFCLDECGCYQDESQTLSTEFLWVRT